MGEFLYLERDFMLSLRSGAAVWGNISNRNERQALLYSCIGDSESCSQMAVLKELPQFPWKMAQASVVEGGKQILPGKPHTLYSHSSWLPSLVWWGCNSLTALHELPDCFKWVVLNLRQFCLPSTPQARVAMSGDIFGGHKCGGCYCHWVPLHVLQCIGHPPPSPHDRELIWPQMSIVPWLRNLFNGAYLERKLLGHSVHAFIFTAADQGCPTCSY